MCIYRRFDDKFKSDMEIRYMEIAQSETAYPAFIVGEIMFLCH